MKYKNYLTKENIELQYPFNWNQVIEENGTYLFYDENSGSLRITFIKIDKLNFNNDDFLNRIFNDNLKYNARWKNINGIKYLYFEKYSNNIENNSYLHFFYSCLSNYILICTYAYDKSLIGNDNIIVELEKVENTLGTLKFK